jgi:diacylglycerol kinase family enzyme
MPLKIDNKFDRFIFLVNPASTHVGQAERRIAELKILFPSVEVNIINTSGVDRDENIKLIRDKSALFGPRTLFCIAAGDGTANIIIEELIKNKSISPDSRRMPILPLWGGNANDLAYMLNGLSRLVPTRTIFTKGKVLPVHPLVCRMTDMEGKTSVRIAACYVSFGASAHAARRLNESGHRLSKLHKLPGGRILQDASTLWNALVKAPTFEIEEAGRNRAVYERTLSNGSRMAKMYHFPVMLNQDQFYMNTLEKSNQLASASMLSFSFMRRPSEKSLHNHTEFTITKATWGQFDGEAVRISSGTKIHINLSELPFYALSVNLASVKMSKPKDRKVRKAVRSA